MMGNSRPEIVDTNPDFGRNKAKAANKEGMSKVRFSDVAGAEKKEQNLLKLLNS